jgi:hypothetical protein
VALWTTARGSTLTDQIESFFDRNAFPVRGRVFSQLVTPLVERIAFRGIDLPVVSTSPAFAYRFSFELGAPERVPGSLGPVFAERVETVGKGRVELGLAYLYANLDQYEGEPFARRIRLGGTVPFDDGTVNQRFTADEFNLGVSTFYFSVTYGVTDRWDVNLLQPVVLTDLQLDGVSEATVSTPGGGRTHLSDMTGTSGRRSGAGDTLLRTKYRLPDPFALAALALTLRLPVGEEENFHGRGDLGIAPLVILSRTFGPHDVHVNLGWDIDADDVALSRAIYAAGVSVKATEHITLLLDVLGSSGVTDERFTVPFPATFPQLEGLGDLIVARRPNAVEAAIPRTDIVNLAAGLKLGIQNRAAASLSAIVPLTTDGLRPAAMVAGTLEVTF